MAESKKEHETDSDRLNQQHSVVYEYTNTDEPFLRRINKPCSFTLDGQTVSIEKDRALLDSPETKRRWITDYATVKAAVGMGHTITYRLDDESNPTWTHYLTDQIPSKRMILVIRRDYAGLLYVDDRKLVRDGLDFRLVPLAAGEKPGMVSPMLDVV